MSKHRVAVLRVVSSLWSVTAAAAKCGISGGHLHRLLRRYRDGGLVATEGNWRARRVSGAQEQHTWAAVGASAGWPPVHGRQLAGSDRQPNHAPPEAMLRHIDEHTLATRRSLGEVCPMDVRRRYEAPGRLVSVDGRSVHVVERGTGPGAVVFEAGVGGNSLDWLAVMAALPARLHLIAYDRLGLGWSDSPSAPRAPDQIVDELESLLRAIAPDPPYILVAHSQGCRSVRLFTARHPEAVAGLVLVDGFHESWDEAVGPAALAAFMTARARLYKTAALMSRTGIMRLLGSRGVSLLGPDFRSLPHDQRARYAAVLAQPRAMDTAIEELRRSGESNGELADASFGDLPLIVVTHGLAFPDATQERAWQDSQTEMTARSSRGRLIPAPGAGHSIMIASPRLVADAIEEVASAAAQTADPSDTSRSALG